MFEPRCRRRHDKEIADVQSDVDAFIAQQSEKSRTVPLVASEIARRLLNAGRFEEAWKAINAVDESKPGWIPFKWEEVRLEVMEALGRNEDAQRFHWQCFERGLNSDHLRAFLKRLPDFDDLEAEERAMSFALRFPSFHQALAFLVSWPALDKAAALVTERSAELDGNHYEILSPASDALAAKHPLAATLLLRAMIDFALKENRVKRYRHAARHLMAASVRWRFCNIVRRCNLLSCVPRRGHRNNMSVIGPRAETIYSLRAYLGVTLSGPSR
jgi:hypothetical protein